MRILLTGASGLVGSALQPALLSDGHEVVRLVRRGDPAGKNEVRWDPMRGALDVAALAGCEAAVHLAGESIVGRWTDSKKQRIRDSRVTGTRVLAEALAKLSRPPRALVCASATGFYGNRADEALTEKSAGGWDFLADVCRAWEAAAAPAAAKGVRVVHLRFGIILSPRGGALKAMLPIFRLGLGGVVGSGAQHWSWVSLADVIGIIRQALHDERLQGPVNVTAPHPVTNKAFTAALGRALKRPTMFPLPAFAARAMLGEMADALLLASARVLPKQLQEDGYVFQQPELERALRQALG